MMIQSEATSDYSTVSNTSQQMATMLVGATYRVQSTTAAFIKMGADPTAAAEDGAIAIAAGETVYIRCTGAAVKLAIIRVAADGHASLTRVG